MTLKIEEIQTRNIAEQDLREQFAEQIMGLLVKNYMTLHDLKRAMHIHDMNIVLRWINGQVSIETLAKMAIIFNKDMSFQFIDKEDGEV
ncbi:MAG: hypothetical protein ABIH23_16775 [bacterium]